MFVFGYGRGNRPPPFDFRRRRPQKSQSGREAHAERVAREAREHEKRAEARERKWQEQQDKRVCIPMGQMRVVLIFSLQQRQTAARRERAEKAKEEDQATKGESRAGREEALKMACQKARSTIFAAARAGRWEQVKKGIREDHVGADGTEVLSGLEEIVPRPKEPKETLLHLATKAGIMDAFRLLVDHGRSH
jgi:hypothetical protein